MRAPKHAPTIKKNANGQTRTQAGKQRRQAGGQADKLACANSAKYARTVGMYGHMLASRQPGAYAGTRAHRQGCKHERMDAHMRTRR